MVAALLDGMSLVIAEVPRSVRAADARRLVARAREREVILVPFGAGARVARRRHVARARRPAASGRGSTRAAVCWGSGPSTCQVDGRGAAAVAARRRARAR